MSQSTTSANISSALPGILAAEASYRDSLCQLATWVRADKARCENLAPDTKEHLMAGLRVLELVSSTAGENVHAHDKVVIHLQAMSEAEQLLARRALFAGTAPHLARKFDEIVLRLACFSDGVAHGGARSNARMN